MECRRISSALLSVGFGFEDKIKRNQYITIIGCKIPGKETSVGKVSRYFAKKNAYYCAVLENGNVQWFGVSGTSSFIKEYPLVVTDARTNIFDFLAADKRDADKRGAKEKKTEEAHSSAESASEGSLHRVSDRSAILFLQSSVLIETPGKLIEYSEEGDRLSEIETGIGAIRSVQATSCENYLLVQYEKDEVVLYSTRTKKEMYRKKGAGGKITILGDVFEYSRFFTYLSNSVVIRKTSTGEALLELTFPEKITSAAVDALERRIVVGTESGQIYHARLDGEEAEFSKSRIFNGEIIDLHFSPCNSLVYALSKGFLAVVSVRTGQSVRNVQTEGKSFCFAELTSSNLHLH